MIETYVYGTPHGFNLFENDPVWEAYFKSFYISSRKGKRLLVNRRADGMTVYNFLCYGLMENEGRPNSFFGCSIVMDGDCFTSDLRTLFDWFDYLFSKIVERGEIFFLNGGRIIQYKIARFGDQTGEVEWLKENMPNIFTKSSDITLTPYTSPFSQSSSGRVVCRNYDTPPEKIAEDFRHVNWVAISPEFKAEEEIDVNFEDLASNARELTKGLLAMAMNPKSSDISRLEEIGKECADVLKLLEKYKKHLHEPEEQSDIETCMAIEREYVGIRDNALQLEAKIRSFSSPSPIPTPDPFVIKPAQKRRVCRSCGRELHESRFPNPESELCNDCTRRKNTLRKCHKCGMKKPRYDFDSNSHVCRACEASKGAPKNKRTSGFVLNWWLIGGSCLTVLLILVAIVFFLRDRKEIYRDDHFNDLKGKEKYVEAIEYAEQVDSYKDSCFSELKDDINSKSVEELETSQYLIITYVCDGEEKQETFYKSDTITADIGSFVVGDNDFEKVRVYGHVSPNPIGKYSMKVQVSSEEFRFSTQDKKLEVVVTPQP